MREVRIAAAVFLSASLCATAAQAALVVSKDPTSNVQCMSGTCSATAANAVLNVAELESQLASSAVTIQPGATAGDIVVGADLKWSSPSALTLDAYRSIFIRRPVSDKAAGPLTLTTNDGGTKGTLSFDRSGHITISKIATPLVINGNTYRLARSIAQLANNIAASPNGFHAFANDYDARVDGSYMTVPIETDFGGTFEGLGNTISNLSYHGSGDQEVALFKALVSTGTLRDVRLTNIDLWSLQSFFQIMGGLVAYSEGHITQCSVTGKLRSDFFMVGGGLVGESYGTVDNSFAGVDVEGAEDATVGGIIGSGHGTIQNVYATGDVSAGDDSDVGGLVGYFIGDVLRSSYSTGKPSGGAHARIGGSLGENQAWASNGKVTKTYWDTDTSGTVFGVGGTTTNVTPGTKGRSTTQLQAGLPDGFKPGIWNERAGYKQWPAVSGGDAALGSVTRLSWPPARGLPFRRALLLRASALLWQERPRSP
ncbi:MAG TPA: hypothetical protein VGG10_15365 [Rhizomicrobium sp.]|jgi:hypothetical protein